MNIRSIILAVAILISYEISIARDNSQFVIDKFIDLYSAGIDEKLYLQTDKPYYSAGEQIWFKGFLLNSITHTPLNFTNYIYVELIDSSGELISRVKVRREEAGFSGYITTLFDQTPGAYTLRAYTKWMMNSSDDLFFTKSIDIVTPIPPNLNEVESQETPQKRTERKNSRSNIKKSLDYTVQFFPEGGALIAGVPQNIAFKAVAEDGLSVEIEGAIFDSQETKICSIKSIHKGMGATLLSSKAGESYYAIISNSKGESKRFELPTVESQGAALTVSRRNGKIYYKANATDPKIIAGAYVVIHSRGKIIAIDSSDQGSTHSISKNQLLDGVSVLSLVDKSDRVLSERIIFKRPTNTPTIAIESDKESYPKRTRASITANILSSDGTPAKGEFGVSVVDNKSVKKNISDGDITSYLLLNSELIGHIEDPGEYFAENSANSDRNLDILMLTQGWRRFDLGDVLAGNTPTRTYGYEEKVQINGEVNGFFGNAARKPNILVLCSQRDYDYMDMFQLDSSNKFCLDDLDMPDSTLYIIQAQGRSGGKSLKLIIEPEVFPEVKSNIPYRSIIEDKGESEVPFEFVNQSQQKFYYEGGTAMLNIDAVYVEGSSTGEEKQKTYYADRSTTRTQLDAMGTMTVDNILQTYSNITFGEDEYGSTAIYYRDNEEDPMQFYLDGSECFYDEINYLTSDLVDSIEVLDANNAMMFGNAPGGVILVTLRPGAELPKVQRANVARVRHLGYQHRATFYQPSYDSPSVVRDAAPDYRTTIYWNGELKSDEKGQIQFDFFTADSPTDYTITIEGVTESGEICRSVSTIQRR